MINKPETLKSDYETYIRNVFVKQYLRNKEAKKKFSVGYLGFVIESGEIDIDNQTVGFIDIKVLNLGNKDLLDEDEYYSFECKRLDGNKTKNKLYINEGIKRYVLSKYSSQMPFAAMIGFVESGINPQIIFDLNTLLKDCKDFQTPLLLTNYQFEVNFKESYKSKHERMNSSFNYVDIFHFMFDLQELIAEDKE